MNFVIPNRRSSPVRNLLLGVSRLNARARDLVLKGRGFSRAAWSKADVGFSP
jgi:hypothetical protein